MIIIGETIHIISAQVSGAVKGRNPRVIQELALTQAEAGADYIDLNLGPARRDPEETMQWLVNAVQEATDLPLSLDTMNPVAMEAGLKVCKKRPLINSASGKNESKEKMLPLAKAYGADLVISVITDRGMPPGVDDRVESILETVAYANEIGIPNEDIWVDPILLPVSANQQEVRDALEFVGMLQDLLPGVKSTIGLSNISNGTPEELRGILNRTYMVMLERGGQYSSIADALDRELISLNKGELPALVNLIHKTMDGEEFALDSLSPQERDYVKTVKVLMGETLYSHAWLDI
ncbi:MAG: 5-methyltetrahydrofolate:corrinoid/iron-sulfur protein co-methyltransferase [Dehalococcoidia bacterium]|nr:5-methyltetrahydrofolate:corrinoid/iron-sulfur protein co-methyltransferase [Chloroflexota bacterium]